MTDRHEIWNKLVEFLEADTDVRIDEVNDSLPLREGLGLDSVDLVGIVMRIEGHYRIRLSHGELERVTTIGALLDLIQAKIAAATSDPVVQSKAA
jgi:acyl carrier protein